MAVSPESESDIEDEGSGAEMVGAEGERIKAEKEPEFAKRILAPLKPTEKEVEDHNRTYFYRNWCPHCVRAKGRDMDHRKAGGK